MKPFTTTLPVLALSSVLSIAASGEELETIVVTGETPSQGLSLKESHSVAGRLGLSIADTPASVEMITREDITTKGDYSPNAAVTRATGIASSANQGNGGTSMTARGLRGHSSIVQTYDGIQMFVGAGTRTFPSDTWTVEKIEVLRGPGSVTNGIGAIGATINYVPKTAQLGEIQNEVDVTLGSFDLQRLAFGSGGSLSNNVAYRVDLLNHESNGYVDNGDEERKVFAGSLLFKPQENLDIKLSVDYSDIEPTAYWGTPLVEGKVKSSTRENNYNVEDGIVDYEDLWPRLNIQWQINDLATLRSDTYYLKAERHWRNVETYTHNPTTQDVDRSLYLEILHDMEQLGNRTDMLLDFATGNIQHKMSVGIELNQIDFEHTNNSPYGGNTSVNLENPIAGTWAQGVQDPTTKDYTSDTYQYALFIEDQIIFNEQWSLVAGLRRDEYDYERSEGKTTNAVEEDFSGTSWRLGTVFKPQQNLSLYAQYSKALDPIGSILTTTTPDLDLAEGEQFEVGIKHALWDNRFQYTIALYDIEKKDLQNQLPGNRSAQIGQQSSQGIEFDFFLQATDTFNIDLNFTKLDAQYDEFVDFSDGRLNDYSGNTPNNVPEMTANLWLNWDIVSNWRISAGARHVDERYTDDENTSSKKLPSYTVYDASVKWAVLPGLDIALRGKNLSDEEDYVLSDYFGQLVLGEGRSFEVGVNYQF